MCDGSLYPDIYLTVFIHEFQFCNAIRKKEEKNKPKNFSYGRIKIIINIILNIMVFLSTSFYISSFSVVNRNDVCVFVCAYMDEVIVDEKLLQR